MKDKIDHKQGRKIKQSVGRIAKHEAGEYDQDLESALIKEW